MNAPFRRSLPLASRLQPEPSLDDATLEDGLDLGFPGFDPARPSLDALSFDSSGSVSAVSGADPVGNRFAEAYRAVQVVRAWSFTRRPKVAVIHFDQPSTGDTTVLPLNRAGSLFAVRAALAIPASAIGSSNLGPALAKAEQLAERYADHDVRLTIFSDFELFDDDLDDIFNRLKGFPGQVHAVVLSAEPPPDLRGENISITRISHDDPLGAVAAAVHRSLTATRRGRRLSPLHELRTQPSIPPLSPENSSKKADL